MPYSLVLIVMCSLTNPCYIYHWWYTVPVIWSTSSQILSYKLILYKMMSKNFLQFILCVGLLILVLTCDLILNDIVAFPVVHPPAYLWTLLQTFYFIFLSTFLATSLSNHSPAWIPALYSSAWPKLYSCLSNSIPHKAKIASYLPLSFFQKVDSCFC